MFNPLRWRRGVPAAAQPAPPAAPPPSGGFATLFGEATASRARRRTVALIGNCLAETLCHGLSAHPLAAGFEFLPVPLHQNGLADAETQTLLGRCAHIFLQTTGLDQLAAIRAAGQTDAPIDLFPDIALRSLWPFDSQSGYRDERIVDTPDAVMRHPDGVLARLRIIEPDPARRFDLYERLDFEEAHTIERIAKAQERFLAHIDTQTEAAIGAFVSGGFRDRPLFYNSTHPSGLVFQALAGFIWDRLGLAGPPPLFTGMDGWRMWSVPVHPRIAKMLGVTWADAATRYPYATLGEVTWEQWVRAYIQHLG
jgi:hypothetical protein